MSRSSAGPRIAAIALVLALAGCGGGDEDGATRTVVVAPPETTTGAAPATTTGSEAGEGTTANPDKPSGPAESATGDPRANALERSAARTVREYVAAIDDRDGARLCTLLAPGAIDAVDLPVDQGDCADSVAASIGYRDPRGLPAWDHGQVSRIRSVEIDGDAGKVVATVLTRFADRDEISVEDDVVYLLRAGDRWLIAKPSSTLYRAVGVADVPPSVIAPPSRPAGGG